MPGLTAKPTVDILLEISGETPLGELQMSLEEAGYLFAAQPGKPAPGVMFMKGYTPEGFAGKFFMCMCATWAIGMSCIFGIICGNFPGKPRNTRH